MAGSTGTAQFNILLLGGTGAGKSTLVNTVVNYFRGGPDLRKRLPSPSELKVAIPTLYLDVTEKEGHQATELNRADRSKSQTSGCTHYHFEHRAQDGSLTRVTLIDSPGLSDTEGRDDANIDQILRAAESLDALHGVVIVANGTDPRCTVTVQNTFTRLKNNLPDSVIANTLAVLTNCNVLTKNFDLNTLPVPVKPEHVFFMNNSVFSSDPAKWELAGKTAQAQLMMDWKVSLHTLKRMMAVVASLAPATTSDFKVYSAVMQCAPE